MRQVEINGIEYYLRNQPDGYGYEIISAEPTGVVSPRGYKQYKRSLLFHTYNRDLVIDVFKRFQNGEVVTDFPDTSDDVPPNRVLVHRSKHWVGHYQANTPEELEKVIRHILKTEYKDYIENISPRGDNVTNESGVKSEEEIESIPIDTVRESVRDKWNDYQKRLKQNEQMIKDYENLKSVVLEDGGNALEAMHVYEGDRWDLEDLTVIK